MSDRRVFTRNEVILLGIICILAVGLIGDIAVNVRLNQQVTDLQNQVDGYDNIVNFREYAIWARYQIINQSANSYNSWTNDAEYAGYVGVQVFSSTTNKTYVEVIYSVFGINYNQRIELGSSGWATFPVEPWRIEVRVGNSNLIDGATENVTITYYY